MRNLIVLLLGFVLIIMSIGQSAAALNTYNSDTPENNDTTRASWLYDIGITESQIEYLVDFESGVSGGQNISGLTDLFPAGLVITDTSSNNSATIVSNIGGSSVIGNYGVMTYEQTQFLELDFSNRPVDYVSFYDIDHGANSFYYIDFAGGGTTIVSLDEAQPAEFIGIFNNGGPKVEKIRLYSGGTGIYWGIDNISYGVVPEPISSILFVTGGMLLAGRRYLIRKS